MANPSLQLGNNNWAVKSDSLLGYAQPQGDKYTAREFTVTRATTATRVDENGLIVTSSIGIARIDYSTGEAALLVEPQGTNLALRSQELDSALIWFPIAATVTANNTTSPDGTVNADKVIATAVTSTHIILQQPLGSVNGTTSTVSIFAKASGLSNIQIVNNAGGLGVANYNLSTGTATLVNGVSASIENYGNGWYRCIMTYTPTNTGNYNIQIRLADSSGNTTFLGNGVDGVSLWGAQLEAGAYATSYIPTTATSVTRNADVTSKTGVSSLIGQTEGTIYAEIKVSKLLGAVSRYIFHLSDGTANNRIYMAFSGASSNILRGRIFSGGTLQCTIDSSTITSNGTYKLALAYKNNDITFYINGVQIGVDTSATIPTGSRVDVGNNYAGASQFSDGISAASIWETRLTNTQLTALTTL